MREKSKFRISENWKKYLVEFLMLFLAVFLGFFAENLRDQNADKVKEKEYISSLIEDVKTDKVILKNVIKNNITRKAYLDTLSILCFNYDGANNNVQELYEKYPIVLFRPDFFIPNELTMLQLKNAGGMRLIHNKNAINAILQYDLHKNLLNNQQKYYENYHNKTIDFGLKIFNQHYINQMAEFYKINDTAKLNTIDFELIQTDKKLITEFGNEVDMYAGIVDYYKILLEETDKQADSLILKLEKEYKLGK